jgi:hypothetical protein
MAAVLPRYRCFSCGLAITKRPFRLFEAASIATSRSYATTATELPTTPSPKRPATKLNNRLNGGPSLGDFVGGKEEAMTREDMLELRTAMVGPPGKQKKITRLPEWLKTPIPDGNNFKKIKNDLRGLNLHTGMSYYALKHQAMLICAQSAKKHAVQIYPIAGEVPRNLLQQLLLCSWGTPAHAVAAFAP